MKTGVTIIKQINRRQMDSQPKARKINLITFEIYEKF
jgi:hypothetical protein